MLSSRRNVEKIIATILLVGTMTSPVSLEAAPAVVEEFGYPTGPLFGQDGGTGWTGSWLTAENVSNPGLTYFDGQNWLAVAGGAAQLHEVSSTVYRTMSLNIPAGSTYYVSFIAQVRSGDSVGVRLPLEGMRCIFVGNSFSPNWQITDYVGDQSTTSTPANVKSFLVVRIDIPISGASTVSLYVNPSLSQEPAIPDASFTTNPGAMNFGSIFLQEIGSSTSVDADIDELRFGPSYPDVTPIAPPVTINSVTHTSDGRFIITGHTLPNQPVEIEATSDLTTSFTTIDSTTADPGGNFEYDDDAAANLPQRFYRASR